jgi:DNA modification methylase
MSNEETIQSSGPKYLVVCGDSLTILSNLDENSVDSVVTDPPAGIGMLGEWDDFRRSRNENDAGRDNQFGRLSRTGPEYARRSREEFVDYIEQRMAACFRVLKPGGYCLVWAIPRTAHWTAWAVENAGFEIRDTFAHLFGTGFSKSMDIAKAVEKRAGIKPIGEKAASLGMANNPQWNAVKRQLIMPALTIGKKYEGWGTALKPGREDWILGRKPIDGTVVSNVLEHGTGGLNLGESKIGVGLKGSNKGKGYLPTNVLIDEEVASELGKGSRKDNSRFFYCPKAPEDEKPVGSDGEGHPTVKSVALMSYLINLITPKKGTILDPFCGSGSTGVAAIRGGFSFIGIEKESKYCEIAERRLAGET